MTINPFNKGRSVRETLDSKQDDNSDPEPAETCRHDSNHVPFSCYMRSNLGCEGKEVFLTLIHTLPECLFTYYIFVSYTRTRTLLLAAVCLLLCSKYSVFTILQVVLTKFRTSAGFMVYGK